MAEYLSAKNLKYLMKINGHTQETLGKELGIAQNTLSNYTRSKVEMKHDVLLIISKKFNVSVKDLVSKDLSDEYDFPFSISLEQAINSTFCAYPQRSSKKAKQDHNFNKAFEISREIYYEKSLDSLDSRICLYEHAIDLYEKAWIDSKTYVALINRVSLILCIYSAYCQRVIDLSEELFNKGKLEAEELSKIIYRSRTQNKPNKKYTEKSQWFLEKYHDSVYDNIKCLKSDLNFNEFGDFFLAQCFMNGFVEPDIDYEVCIQTFSLMVYQQILLENPLTIKLVETLVNIDNHDIL